MEAKKTKKDGIYKVHKMEKDVEKLSQKSENHSKSYPHRKMWKHRKK